MEIIKYSTRNEVWKKKAARWQQWRITSFLGKMHIISFLAYWPNVVV